MKKLFNHIKHIFYAIEISNKTTSLLLLSLSMSFITNAQLTDINVQGLTNNPSLGVIYGDFLYVTRFTASAVSRIDLSQTNPQAEEIFTDITLPYGIALNGNDLYIKSSQGDREIFWADLSQSNPSAIALFQPGGIPGTGDSSNMQVINNSLYICNAPDGSISRVDLNDPNYTVVEVISGLNSPRDLELVGNYLYISENYGNKISRIDITDTNPVATDVVTDLDFPTGMVLRNNYLYFVNSGEKKIYRIDITEPNPTAMEFLATPATVPTDVLFYNDDMYIINGNGSGSILKYEDESFTPNMCNFSISNNGYFSFPQVYGQSFMTECTGDLSYIELNVHPTLGARMVPASTLNIYSGNTVNGTPIYSQSYNAFPVPSGITTARINLLNHIPVLANEQYTFTMEVGDLEVEGLGGDNYVAGEAFADGVNYPVLDFGFGAGIVESTLSNESLRLNTEISIYPNPAKDFITVSGDINLDSYTLYDMLGKVVKNGELNNKKRISIQHLSRGMYFIKFNNGVSLKFLKE